MRAVKKKAEVREWVGLLKLLAPDFFFLILAHSVYKM
jgi:hypothetical protein